MIKTLLFILFLLLTVSGLNFAHDLPPPPPSPSNMNDDLPEPEIHIRASDEGMIEEYRIRGRLYMVKITPKDAPAYYLIDNDGDGELETRHNGPMEPRLLPQWILLRW